MNQDFSFNGVNASTKYFELGRYFDSMPEQAETIIDMPDDGDLQASKKFKSKIIPVNGVLYANSSAELITRIQDFLDYLRYDTDVRLIFNDKADRYYNAQYLDSMELGERGIFVPMELRFKCNKPFAYGITAITDHQDITVNETTYLINNTGHYYAYPVITITFNQPQTHIYVENNSFLNNRFDISKSFVATDVLVVDCKAKTIFLNSAHNPAGFGTGGSALAKWIVFAKGNNQLEIGTDDGTIDVDIDISFEPVYYY